MTTSGSYVHKPYGKISRGTPKMFPHNFDGFRQNNLQGF